MGDYLLNTIIVTALSLVILLVVALPASYVLARFDFVGKKFFNGLFMAGLFVNVNYIVLPIFLMLFNADIKLGVDFFLNSKFWLSVVYAATALPFTIYLLTGYFKTLPKAYEEAARIDGCGYFKTMTKIMIPMARPSIITVILFQFLAFWNEYIIAFTFMDKDNATLAVGVKYLMADAKSQANFGVMYAGLVIVMIDDNKVMNIVMIILFFVFLGLIIWAQKTVSVRNLMIEIVGLTGLLTLLFLYNKKHK